MLFEDGPAVAITDRGLRHRHNEDAAAVGALENGGAVLVVCDGVSSTPGSAQASSAAVSAARDLLVGELGALAAGTQTDADPSAVATVEAALVAATKVAQAEAAAAPEEQSNAPYSQGGPPSSTFVAAVALPSGDGASVSVAWLGDSRAYWISASGGTALTEDHEIEGSLTRWIGADNVDDTPSITHLDAEGPGLLLLCSDGLWRYADPAPELSSVVERLAVDASNLADLASALVEFALAGGGHDNITVALWDRQAATGQGSESVSDVPATVDDAVETTGVNAPASPVPPAGIVTQPTPLETDSRQESGL